MVMSPSSLAYEIDRAIGGRDNMREMRHCVTRLRLQLKDSSRVDTKAIQDLDGVLSVVEAAGEYQIVLGSQVQDVYAALSELHRSTNKKNLATSSKKRSLLDGFVDLMGGLFQPFLGVMCAAGILRGVTAIMGVMGADKTSGLYVLFNTLGDGFYQYLPFMLSVTAAKKFKMNPYTAMAIAAALLYPNITTILEGTNQFLGLPIALPSGGYYQTILPIILAIFVASYVEKWLNRVIPSVVKMFLVPFFVIMITVVLTYLFVGPLANTVSAFLGKVLEGVYQANPTLYGFILGALWQVLVMFGLHRGLIPLYILQLSTEPHMGTLLVAASLPCFAQVGVMASLLLKREDKDVKRQGSAALISALVGVSEPAIYGYSLPRKTPFVISCIAGAIAGAYVGFFKVSSYSLGGLGIFLYPSYINPKTGDLSGAYHMMIASVLACLVSFILMQVLPSAKQSKLSSLS